MSSKITIVTAFFDIGRENWTTDKGYPDYLFRAPETYIDYFKNLATLDNEIIIFTSQNYAERIKDIRKDKPTHVVVIDYPNEFKVYKEKINKIQQSESYRSKVSAKQLINPEYWSSDYALLTNLKSYFVSQAIKKNLTSNDLVAWIDFGYCRDMETLNGVVEWKYDFDHKKVHIFSLKKIPWLTLNKVKHSIYNNKVFIIGGITIAERSKWIEFQKLIYGCQIELLKNGIVDDDQGVYLFAFYKKSNIFKNHILGKNRWRTLFETYDVTANLSFKQKFKKLLNIL